MIELIFWIGMIYLWCGFLCCMCCLDLLIDAGDLFRLLIGWLPALFSERCKFWVNNGR